MHFCADELRSIIAAIHSPGVVWLYVKSWFRRSVAWVRTKCRRCPRHCH